MAIARLLPLCFHADELTIDEALDTAVIDGQATVSDFRIRWNQRDGFTFTPDPTGLHDGLHEAALASAALPQLISPPGSWPTDCLVVIGLNASGHSAVALRYDNDPPDPLGDLPGPLLDPDSAGQLADSAAGFLARSSIPAAIVIRYGRRRGADPSITAFRERLPAAGLRLAAVVSLGDSGCACLCGDPRCDWTADLPTAADGQVPPGRPAVAAALSPAAAAVASAAHAIIFTERHAAGLADRDPSRARRHRCPGRAGQPSQPELGGP